MSAIVFDIETGPLPWEQISQFYQPPAGLPPWNDSMVKYGVTKDPEKRKAKYDEVKATYAAQLAKEAETCEQHKAEWLGNTALSPVTGQVLAIGVKSARLACIIGEGGESEAEILAAWWGIYTKNNSRKFVGYCSNLFDLPFLVWRSYFHGIIVPESAWDKTGRYAGYQFVDLIDKLPKRGFSDQGRKLGDICSWLGIGGKPDGVDGAAFAGLWWGPPEDRAQAVAYLANDLEMTWQLGQRMGVVG